MKRFEPIVKSTLCLSHINDLPCWKDGWLPRLGGCRLDAEYVTHVCSVMRVCVLVPDLLIGYFVCQRNISSAFLMLCWSDGVKFEQSPDSTGMSANLGTTNAWHGLYQFLEQGRTASHISAQKKAR